MNFGWIEILLACLAVTVITLLAIWAWDTFRAWRINRDYSPTRRQK